MKIKKKLDEFENDLEKLIKENERLKSEKKKKIISKSSKIIKKGLPYFLGLSLLLGSGYGINSCIEKREVRKKEERKSKISYYTKVSENDFLKIDDLIKSNRLNEALRISSSLKETLSKNKEEELIDEFIKTDQYIFKIEKLIYDKNLEKERGKEKEKLLAAKKANEEMARKIKDAEIAKAKALRRLEEEQKEEERINELFAKLGQGINQLNKDSYKFEEVNKAQKAKNKEIKPEVDKNITSPKNNLPSKKNNYEKETNYLNKKEIERIALENKIKELELKNKKLNEKIINNKEEKIVYSNWKLTTKSDTLTGGFLSRGSLYYLVNSKTNKEVNINDQFTELNGKGISESKNIGVIYNSDRSKVAIGYMKDKYKQYRCQTYVFVIDMDGKNPKSFDLGINNDFRNFKWEDKYSLSMEVDSSDEKGRNFNKKIMKLK